MNCKETMAALEAAGSEQYRKTYRRHGVKNELFGISYAFFGKLKKQIKVDHALAIELWDTDNHDARVLATMIADPTKLDVKTAEAWIKACDNYAIAGAVATCVAQSPLARKLGEKFAKAKDDYAGAAGWHIIGSMATLDTELPDDYFVDHLGTIEAQIHDRPNRTRYSMLTGLICIGIRNAALGKLATAAAKRIGDINVDHGDTDCKTPDPVAYIAKVAARNAGKKPAAGKAKR